MNCQGKVEQMFQQVNMLMVKVVKGLPLQGKIMRTASGEGRVFSCEREGLND